MLNSRVVWYRPDSYNAAQAILIGRKVGVRLRTGFFDVSAGSLRLTLESLLGWSVSGSRIVGVFSYGFLTFDCPCSMDFLMVMLAILIAESR